MSKDIFQAIADPTRRAILTLIALHPLTPNAIAGHFTCTRQAISKHIQVLADSQLLEPRQHGREIHYHLNATRMQEVDLWLQQFRDMWESRFQNLDNLLANNKTKKQ